VPPPISALEFRQPDDTGVLFDIGRLEFSHPIQIEWPHRHTFYEIIWVIDGAGVHAADFEEHAIGPHTVYLISPGQVHAMRVDRPLTGYRLAFTADFFVLDGRVADAVADLPFFRVGAANPVLAPNGEEAALLRVIAEDLLAEFTSRASWRREMLRARFQTLLLSLGRVAERQQVHVPPVTGTAARFHTLIEARFRRLHRVADYAALLALTPGHLNRVSKDATGESASVAIESRLVLEAKRLLVHSDAPAAEIAAQLGFPDPSYFGRFFRRHVAQSPRAFRAEVREKYQNNR
jgi:AraC family transcriptional regulator, transcriptional activator of pobA